jgi:hypothetical protein
MNIDFMPFSESKNNQLLKPIPAITNLPDWYKKKSPFADQNKETKAFANGTKNITVKWCNPFGDALGAGYFMLLENDVQVTQENGSQSFVWFRGGNGFIGEHSKDQISSELIPEGYSNQPWKFTNFWGIKTPPGYSTLFTHPMNRTELPFLTLSGVVDTDDYNQPVNFPFVIRNDFEGIIEAGTPIAQVVPFRRESWKATFQEFDPTKTASIQSKFSRKITRPYKLGYWKRKEYK